MQTIHALLAIPQPYSKMLAESLTLDFEVHLINTSKDADEQEWDILDAIRSLLNADLTVDDFVVLVTIIEETEGIPAFCERLLTEFPEVTVMGICRSTSVIRSFQLQIQVQEMHASLAGLSAAIKACTSRALPW